MISDNLFVASKQDINKFLDDFTDKYGFHTYDKQAERVSSTEKKSLLNSDLQYLAQNISFGSKLNKSINSIKASQIFEQLKNISKNHQKIQEQKKSSLYFFPLNSQLKNMKYSKPSLSFSKIFNHDSSHQSDKAMEFENSKNSSFMNQKTAENVIKGAFAKNTNFNTELPQLMKNVNLTGSFNSLQMNQSLLKNSDLRMSQFPTLTLK